jgi:EmrB/QacA subfamily drug resistance transporter
MTTVDRDLRGPAEGADPRRWLALGVLAAMQFMLMMDVTVVNIALPKIQDDLQFSYEGLAWVVNAYLLTAGGFLLLGGRMADLFGRRRVFVLGVVVFGLSSAWCGAATEPWMLVSGRFAQGLGEALAGPAALGSIPLLFSDSKERMKALGAWGGVAALGGAVGSVVGGLVTDLVNWRWVFFINVPVALVVLFMIPRVLKESRMEGGSRRIDTVGATAVTGGLIAVVYGLLQAADHPWGSGRVLLPLLGGVALLVSFVLWETRQADPMVPLRFFRNRTRVTTNVISLAALAAFYTYAFLATLFLQQVLGFSPLQTGLAYIPLTIAMGTGMGVATSLMPRIGAKPVVIVSLVGSAGGLLLASGLLDPDAAFASHVLPGLLVYGFFNAFGYPALINGALHKVTGQDSGLASGVQTAMQQVGAALGLAALVPIALRYIRDHVATGTVPAVAQADGYAVALVVAAGVLVVTAVLAVALMEKVDGTPRDALAEASDDTAAEVGAPATAGR